MMSSNVAEVIQNARKTQNFVTLHLPLFEKIHFRTKAVSEFWKNKSSADKF